jgi:hypothetical protein
MNLDSFSPPARIAWAIAGLIFVAGLRDPASAGFVGLVMGPVFAGALAYLIFLGIFAWLERIGHRRDDSIRHV